MPTATSSSKVVAQQSTKSDDSVQLRSTGSASVSVNFNGETQTWSRTPEIIGDVEVTESSGGHAVVITPRDGANGAPPLQHTGYGVWLKSSATDVLAGSSTQVTGVSSFVIGDPTPVGAMPPSGTASYRGQAVAVELRPGQSPQPLSGPFDATANFGTSRVDATADLENFGRVSMNSLAIAGNQFSGSATGPGHIGTVKGGFTGPAAAELGGTFELGGSSTVQGAFAARKP